MKANLSKFTRAGSKCALRSVAGRGLRFTTRPTVEGYSGGDLHRHRSSSRPGGFAFPSARLKRWASNISDRALSALVAAWIITVTATLLIVSALAVASVWEAVRAALSSEL
jgi:hypothetical protein